MPAMSHMPVWLRSRDISQRAILAAFAGILILGLSLVYVSDMRTVTARSYIGAQNAPRAASQAPAAAAGIGGATMTEMHIANDGLTYLQNATVQSVSDGMMTVSIAWGAMSVVWNVQTNTAKFLDDNGNGESSANIQAGDHVNITGSLDENAQEPTIDAQYVRGS